MKVIIENFRCFSGETAVERSFDEGKVILFNGISGKGKSTTFDAILWCLFGKIQGIYPITAENKVKKTRVIFEFNEIIISREKTPEVLSFHDTLGVYEGKIAQERIYQIFGDEDLFIATSYLQQGRVHPLNSLSSSDKFSLLYNLTFGYSTDNRFTPEAYFNVLNSEINLKSTNLKEIEGIRNYIQESCDRNTKCFDEIRDLIGEKDPVEMKSQLCDDNLQLLKSIKELEIQKEAFYKAKYKREAAFNHLRIAQDQFEEVKIALGNAENVSDQQIGAIQRAIEIISRKNEIEKRLKEMCMSSEVINLDKIDIERLKLACVSLKKFVLSVGLADDSVEKAFEKASEVIESNEINSKYKEEEADRRARFQEYVSSLKEKHSEKRLEILKIEVKNEDILKKKYQLKLYEENEARKQKYGEIEREKIALKEEFKQFKADFGDDSFPQSRNIDKKLDSISRILESLKCPECNTTLSVKNGILVKVLSKDERKSLENLRDSLKTYQTKVIQFELKLDKLNRDKIVDVSKPEPFDDKIEEPPKLEPLRVPVYEPQARPDCAIYPDNVLVFAKEFIKDYFLFPKGIISKLINDVSNYDTYKTLDEENRHLSIEKERRLEDLVAERDHLMKKKTEYESLSRKYETYSGVLAKAKIDLESCPQIEFDEESFKDGLDTYEKNLKLASDLTEFIKHEEKNAELQSRNLSILSLRNDVQVLTDLKKTAEFVSIESINDRIISLEETTNSLLKCLFEKNPIKVSIKAIKEAKTKKSTEKNQVNITITRDNFELKRLSGGENSRMNLALTLAMNIISGSKILFLDEVLDGIEEELKETTVDLIRDQCFMKTVVFICHNSVKGMYDSIVTI